MEPLVFRRYRKKLASQSKGRVLEVGIGTGRNLPFYPAACEITGVDISEKMVEEGRIFALNLGIAINLLVMDVENLGFNDNTFDTVLCTLSLCTVPNPIRALSEMKRVCKSEGRILLLEHVRSYNSFLSKVQDWLTPLNIRKIGCHLNRDTLENAKKAGLNVGYVEKHLVGTIYIIHATCAK
ncbi:MAG: class I SAM-dependent methyltransferase [Ignavibacteriales bacterium]